MTKTLVRPYHINHIHLDSQQNLPLLDHREQGNYVVFWWREIPLGHVFIEPNRPCSESDYLMALIAAITPAVQHYMARAKVSSAPWEAWLSLRNFERWSRWMDALLASWQPAAVLSQVPVTVIICTRNRATQLRRCLEMLQELPCAPTEIVVVDNASNDASTQQVAQAFPGVVYVREPRSGLDYARNTGIVTATSPVIAFVDDDVVVHPMLVYWIWEAFQQPNTVALTGLVIALELKTEAQLIFEKHWSFNRGYVDKVYDVEFMPPVSGQVPPVWEIGAGANMAFRKAVFENVGYFDELLDVGAAGCSGDSEMWHRILSHGYAIHYSPRAVAYHEHRRDMVGLKHQLHYYLRGHVAAALIQHAHQPDHGYAKHIFFNTPKYYGYLLRAGFPFFRFRYRTLWAEMKGIASGVAFYYRTRNRTGKH